MLINVFFSRRNRSLPAAAGMIGLLAAAAPALAQSYTAAPTPVYGSMESQSAIRFHGPGLPGSEPRQSVNGGPRHVFFDVAGYDGEVFSPVNAPYNSAATYRTYGGQPGNGANALLAESVTGAP